MNNIFKKLYKLKTLVSKNISFLFLSYIKFHIKFHIRLLNVISKNLWFYSFYMFAIIFSNFGCYGKINCLSIHVIMLMFTCYLQSSCLELYLVCRISATRKWIIQLVGKEYFVANFPTGSQLLVKYFVPMYCLLLIDILSGFLLLHFDMGVAQVLCNHYESIYGVNRLDWPETIKYELLTKLTALPIHNQGIIKILGSSMTHLYNYIWSRFL